MLNLKERIKMIYKYNEKNKRIINDEFNVVDVYNEKFSNIDYVVVNLNGEHGACINTKSTKYWLILDGKANVYLDGEVSEVTQGDFVIINSNIKHNIIGKVKFGVVCNPPFDANYEKYD